MSYFIKRPTKRITLKDNYYIDVYTKLTYADRYEFARFGGSLAELANLALLRVAAGWNLDDESGNILELSPENLGLVDGKDVQPLIDFVDELMTNYLESLNPEIEKNPEKKSSPKTQSATSEPSPELK